VAVAGGSTAAVAAAQHSSSYRVKLQRREFLRLVERARESHKFTSVFARLEIQLFIT
jgi:hypothetical protein